MAKPCKLKRPPIAEAILQVSFAGQELTMDDARSVSLAVGDESWSRDDIHILEAKFGLSDSGDPSASSSKAAIGVRVVSPEKQRIARIERNRFAVSIVDAYSSWEDLESFAESIFALFTDRLKDASVSEISTRFINRVVFLNQDESFEAVLTRPPLPLNEVPGAFVKDFVRTHLIGGLPNDYNGTITIGTIAGKESDPAFPRNALIVDVDVSKQVNLPMDFSAVSAELKNTRAIKNELFFGSITQEALERFR